MSKKDLQSVTANLKGLAENFPTQRPAAPVVPLSVISAEPAISEPPKPASKAEAEREVQVGFYIRMSLRKELNQLAVAAGHDTARSFILAALKDKGLSVTQADLVDRRRRS